MALKLAHMLSSSGLQAAPVGAPPTLIFRGQTLPGDDLDEASGPVARRTRIWEFGVNLHCSIIGTCLTATELRHIIDKLDGGKPSTASDHDLHIRGVTLAGRRGDGAKFLQKALDRRHRVAVSRFAKAKDTAGVLAQWDEALKQGDIPGAYWAALTHPAATDEVVKRAFGDVHMLSHLVGAANRADIRRLRELEEDNAARAATIGRQQSQLRDGFAARDRTIRHLNEMLARRASEQPAQALAQPDDAETVDKLIRDLDKRLARETARRERGEQRVRELAAALAEAERTLQADRLTRDAALDELDMAERHLAALTGSTPQALDATLDLSGTTILYVGGRAHQVPLLKGQVERAGGSFLHHDGGIEHSAGLLPGLVGRADHIVFPIDCISHDAAGAIKRLCRQVGKRYEPLRTASLACLLAALTRLAGTRTGIAAE